MGWPLGTMKRKAEDSDEPEPTGGASSTQAEKKRKTDDGGAIPSATRRATRSQKPCLSIEMIAKVASFANYGDDLMNICVAVGPTESNIVRHVCLRNNLNYLRHVLERTIQRTRNTGRFRLAHSSPEKACIEEWMIVNSDWRKYCTKERVMDAKYCKASFRDEHDDGKKMYSSDPLILFNNPCVAIEFGVVDILKYLVENVGIDINAYNWAGFGGADKSSNVHLLTVANNKGTLEYLLSRNELDVCAPVEEDNVTLSWYVLFLYARCGSIFESVVKHESFNANGHDKAGSPHLLWATILCGFNGNDNGGLQYVSLEARLRNIQCMLDAGADPEQGVDNGFPTPTILQHTRSELRKEAELGSAKAETWKRLITMMEDAVAARNVIGGN